MILFAKKSIPLLLAVVLQFMPMGLTGQGTNAPSSITNLTGRVISTDSLEAFLSNQMKTLNVPGVSLAVINEGKLVYERAQGYADIEKQQAVSPNTIFEGASLSKPLFAFLIMHLVEEGTLTLDTPLYEYLPYPDIAKDERYKKITARMVLSHTTGFPNWRTDYKEHDLFISFEPGSAFQYSGEGYQYLAKVAMHLLKTDDKGLEIAYQERIAKPLGLHYSKYLQDAKNMQLKAKGYRNGKPVEEDDDPGIFGAAFSIHSHAADFSNWLIALIEKKGLSEESFQELLKSQVTLPEGHPQTQGGVTDWTLGFAKAQLPFGTFYGHGGNNPGYTSIFIVSPDTGWGFVIFTNADQSNLPMALVQYLMTP